MVKSMRISTENFVTLVFNSEELFSLAKKCKAFENTAQNGDSLILAKKRSLDDGYTKITFVVTK